jgi:peptidoglycan/LPS O-acetylase OafA/YrhL
MPEIRPLTALRGWLALWVVLYHLSPLIPKSLAPLTSIGDVAVDVFFLLSGFVIALNYTERLAPSTDTARGYASFLWARLARIYPVHAAHQLAWLLLVASAAALGRAGITWTQLELFSFLRALLLIQAWGSPMQMTWNYPSWSVSLEWLVYLAAPALLLLPRLGAKIRAGRIALCLALWLLLLASHQTPWEHLVRVGSEFATGACLAAWHQAGTAPRTFARLRWLFVAGFLILLLLTAANDNHGFALPLAAAGLLGFAQRTRAPAWQVYCGRISYSLYIAHALAITLLHQVLPPSPSMLILGAYLLGIYALGVASYHLVERPAQRWLVGRREHHAHDQGMADAQSARQTVEPGGVS